MSETMNDVQHTDIKKYYQPLRGMGFTRAVRGRSKDFVHVYAKHFQKFPGASVIVRLTWDDKHVVTYQNGTAHGPDVPFNNVNQMRDAIAAATEVIETSKPKKRGIA